MRYFKNTIILLISGLFLFSSSLVSAEEKLDVVTVPYTITGVNAEDVNEPLKGNVQFKEGETSKDIELTIKDNKKLEGKKSITLTVDPAPVGVTLGTNNTATVKIDSDPGAPIIVTVTPPTSLEVNEGTGEGTTDLKFTAKPSRPFDGIVTVRYVVRGTGENLVDSTDISLGSARVSLENGETKEFSISINKDESFEPDETFVIGSFSLSASTPDGTKMRNPETQEVIELKFSENNPTFRGTILNDDKKPASVGLEDKTITKKEGEEGETTKYSFPLILEGFPRGKPTTITYDIKGEGLKTSDFDGGKLTGITLTLPDTVDSANIDVGVVDNEIVEGNKTFTVVITDLSEGVILKAEGVAKGTILNDDKYTVSLTPYSGSLSEAEKSKFKVEVSLNQKALKSLSIPYTVTGDGIDNNDFNDGIPGVLEFAKGDLTKYIELTVKDDKLVEETEKFVVALSAEGLPKDVKLATTSGTAIAEIINNLIEIEPSIISLSTPTVTKLEGGEGDTTEFEFILKAVPPMTKGTIRMDYEITVDGVDEKDFVFGGSFDGLRGTLDMTGGEKKFTVQIKGDKEVEPDESFKITFKNIQASLNTGYTGVGAKFEGGSETLIASGFIKNDDFGTASLAPAEARSIKESEGSLSFAVELDTVMDTDTTLTYTLSGEGIAPRDFKDNKLEGSVTIPANTKEQSFTIEVADDEFVEEDEKVVVTLSDKELPNGVKLGNKKTVTATILNDDSYSLAWTKNLNTLDEAKNSKIKVPLFFVGGSSDTRKAHKDLSIPYTVTGAGIESGDFEEALTGTKGALSGTVVIPKGESGGIIVLTAKDDEIAEATELFTIGLVADGLPKDMELSLDSGDPTKIGMGDIINNPIKIDKEIVVSLVTDSVEKSEGSDAKTTNFEFTLKAEPTITKEIFNSVEMEYEITSESGVDKSDLATELSGTFKMKGGEKKFIVQVKGDKEVETDESFQIVFKNIKPKLKPGYIGGGAKFKGTSNELTATGYITNDDLQTLSIAAGEANESDGIITFKVELDQPVPSHDTIKYSYTVAAGGGVNPATAKDFAGGVFPKEERRISTNTKVDEISISLENDDQVEKNETFTVTLSLTAATKAAKIVKLGKKTAIGIILNDDVNHCAANPCQNGGQCTNGETEAICSCSTGYQGKTCGDVISPTAGKLKAKSKIVESEASTKITAKDWKSASGALKYEWSAACDGGLGSGSFTDVKSEAAGAGAGAGACANNPCMNGGTCSNQGDSYQCSCATGYAGASCENDIDECASATCPDGQLCIDGVGTYICQDETTGAIVKQVNNEPKAVSAVSKTWTAPKNTTVKVRTCKITVKGTDSSNNSNATAPTEIKVKPGNQAPVANDDAYKTKEDTVLEFMESSKGVLGNDTGTGLSSLTESPDWKMVEVIKDVKHGKLQMGDTGYLRYTPNKDFNGKDTFTYKAKNRDGDSSNEATVTITINPVNDAPVVKKKIDDQEITAGSSDRLKFNLYEVFNDADGDVLSFTGEGFPKNEGRVQGVEIKGELTDKTLILTPEYMTGPAEHTITITADDKKGEKISTTFKLTVKAKPAATSISTPSDKTIEITAGDKYKFKSEDFGNHIKIRPEKFPKNGLICGDASMSAPHHCGTKNLPLGASTITYQSDKDYVGKEIFKYKLSESSSQIYTITFKIMSANDAAASSTNKEPVGVKPISPEAVTVGSSIELYIALEKLDGESINNLSVGGLPLSGNLYFNNHNILGTPSDPDIGEYTIRVWGKDSKGREVSTTFKLTVKPAKQKESKPLQISLSRVDVEQDEGQGIGGNSEFNFALQVFEGAPKDGYVMPNDVTVKYSVKGSGSNPANAADFPDGALPQGEITFNEGKSPRGLIVIAVKGDRDAEPNEAFTLTLQPTSGITIGNGSAIGIIKNDDGGGSGSQSLAAQNACVPNPCANGASCSTTGVGSGYQCACPSGYSGVDCEIFSSNAPDTSVTETKLKKEFTLKKQTFQLYDSRLISGSSPTEFNNLQNSVRQITTPEKGNCSDGIDNDGDGLIDTADTVDCPTTTTTTIPPAPFVPIALAASGAPVINNDANGLTNIEIRIDDAGVNTVSAALDPGFGGSANGAFLFLANGAGQGALFPSGGPFAPISPMAPFAAGTTNIIMQRITDSVFFKITINWSDDGGFAGDSTLTSVSGFNCGLNQADCP